MSFVPLFACGRTPLPTPPSAAPVLTVSSIVPTFANGTTTIPGNATAVFIRALFGNGTEFSNATLTGGCTAFSLPLQAAANFTLTACGTNAGGNGPAGNASVVGWSPFANIANASWIFGTDGLTPGSGANVTDITGNGTGNAVLGTGGIFLATWGAKGLNFAPTSVVSLSPGNVSNIRTMHIVCSLAKPPISGGSPFPTILGTDASNTLFIQVTSGLNGFIGSGGKGDPKLSSSKKILGNNVLSFTLGSSPAAYQNGNETPAYWKKNSPYTLSASSQAWLGAIPGVGAGYTGTIYYYLSANGTHSATDIRYTSQWLTQVVSNRNVPMGDNIDRTLPNLVFEGSSLTGGAVTNDASDFPSQTVNNLTNPVNHVNLGIGGQASGAINGAFATRSAPLFASCATKNIYIYEAGINDLQFSAGGVPSLESNAAATLDAAHSAGYLTVALTTASATTANPSFDTERATYNAWLAGLVGTKVDVLVDVAANATMGANGASANTTYFSDGIHWTPAGATIVAGLVRTGLGSLGIS